MKRAFAILLAPVILLVGSLTAFAGDAELPYKPITQPPVISKAPSPPIQPADPSAIERAKGIASGKHPDSFQDPFHNNGPW